MPSCEINYDNKSKGIFYSGQIISGNILFNNEKSRKILGITLTFEGYAKCKWNKHKGQYYTKIYNGREDFVNEVKKFISSENEGKMMELPQGVHTYPFSFTIPSKFPTSVEGFNKEFNWDGTHGLRGCVRYRLTIKAARSWKPDITYTFPLTIIKNLDLNYADPRYRSPVTIEEVKNFSFSSKLLHMSVNTSITSFVCGQKTSFAVCYKNDSSVDVQQTKVKLMRINHYTADKPTVKTKTGSDEISMKAFEGVKAKTAKNVEVHLVIPSVPPSSDGSCRVMNISYEIHVTAVFGGLHSDHTLKLPILIGTVPYLALEYVEDNLPEYSNAVASTSQQKPNITSTFALNAIGWTLGPSTSNTFTPRSLALVPSIPEDYDMPPPTYMEAVSGSPQKPKEKTASSDDEIENFTPSYPVYNFDQKKEKE